MQKADFKVYNSAIEAEQARLSEAAASTYTTRFYTLMRLIKVSSMIKSAKIISSPVLPQKNS